MYCPRCGRAVNPQANFCGGCGLSRVEIEKYIQNLAPQQETKTEPAPQQETSQPAPQPAEEVKAETAQVAAEAAETVAEAPKTGEPAKAPAADVTAPAEAPKAESVFTEPEQVKAEDAQHTAGQVKTEPEQPKAEPAKDYHQYTYTQSAQNSSQQTGYTAQQNTYAQQPSVPEVKKEVPLSTVDFIWVLIISGIPLVGLIYTIYLAVQDNNINKRSYARASLIIAAFVYLIVFVFGIGIVAAGIMG